MRNHTEPFYSKEDGLYFWNCDGHKVCIGEEVAIAYDAGLGKDHTTMLKHGSKKNVEKWFEEFKTKCVALGENDLLEGMGVVSSKEFSTEDLDKIINIAGFIGIWLYNRGFITEGGQDANSTQTDHG